MDKPTDELEWRMQRVRHFLARLPMTHLRAIIFGSVARGDFVKESDTDLLVISDEFPDSVKERIDLLFDLIDFLRRPHGSVEFSSGFVDFLLERCQFMTQHHVIVDQSKGDQYEQGDEDEHLPADVLFFPRRAKRE